MKVNQNGVGAIEVLLMLVVVGLIGGISWYVWHSKNEISKSLNESSSASQSSVVSSVPKTKIQSATPAAPVTLTDARLKYSKLMFAYDPALWKVNNNTSTEGEPCGKSDSANLQYSGAPFQLNFSLSACGKGGGSCANPDLHCRAESESLATVNLSSSDKAYVVVVRTTTDSGQSWNYGLWLSDQPTCADSVICPMKIKSLASTMGSFFGTYLTSNGKPLVGPKSLDDFAGFEEIKAATALLKTLHYE